jgi:hypothetical protein
MNENYEMLCREFCALLRKTRFLADLRELVHIVEPNGTRKVLAVFNGGYRKKINVTSDSGIAMLADILKGLTR